METGFDKPNHYAAAVHWDTSDSVLPLWQLRRGGVLRVDISAQFGAKFKVTAICGLTHEVSTYLKTLMANGTIPCTRCGQSGYRGYTDDIFNHTLPVGEGWGWHVTNNAMEAPGFVKAATSENFLSIPIGSDIPNSVTRHPNDGYTVQFSNVPWAVFKRYWRKPINLHRQFHGQKIKTSWRKNHTYATCYPAVFNLHFDLQQLRNHKHIFVDFHRGSMKEANPHMNNWMVMHATKFYTMSDGDSPFVKPESEFLFTTDFMSRLP
jgi:hypothetical protein